MKPGFEVRTTEDGSPTVYSELFGATYHSQKGALEESRHVFIKNGLFIAQTKFPELKILEVGFGTGLNALLTLQHAKVPVNYYTLEKFPLPESIYKNLNYGDKLFDLHNCDWNTDVKIDQNFSFHKINKGIEDISLSSTHHLIYMDAFAPSTQKEIWQKPILEKLYNSLVKGGVLVTFCAQGQFKRDLKALGFTVESVVGAVGKREMTRAFK